MSESDEGQDAEGPCVEQCDAVARCCCRQVTAGRSIQLLLLPAYLLPAWLHSSSCHSYAAMSEFIGCARPIESRRVAR